MSGSPSSKRTGQVPWTWGEFLVEGDQVVVLLRRWRKLLATKAEVRFPLHSIVRVEHDPLARAHVRSGLRNWRRHGQGVWRLGIYHGIDGWSFWSIGLGRNAVMIECSGQRFRYVVVEVADPGRTVREIRVAAARVTGEIPGVVDPSPPKTSGVIDEAVPRGRRARQRGRLRQ